MNLSRVTTAASEPALRGGPLRLLIVEDDPRDVELMVTTLERAGYRVAFDAVDSAEVLEQKLGQPRYDVILSDHNLRTWNGLQALEIVQRSGKDIPFIVVTATLGDEAAVGYIRRGAADYLLKEHLERLAAVVERALREKALREESSRLQQVIERGKKEWELTFDTVPDPMFLLDGESHIKRVNRAAARMLGLEFSQIIGRHCYEVLHDMVGPRPDCPHQQMLHTLKEARGDIEEPKLGRIFDVTTTPLCDRKGVLRGSVHVMRDITGRKRAEETLRQTQARYQLMVEGSEQVFFYVYDREHRLEYLSPSVSKVLGYEPAELLGQSYEAVLTGDPSDALVAEFTDGALGDGERRPPYLAIVRHKDGRRIVLEMVETPVERNGVVIGVQGFARDITERKRAEEALRQSEARFRELVENAVVGIYRVTLEGKFLGVNPALVAMLGYNSKEELMARNLATDIYRDLEERGRVIEQYRRTGSLEGIEAEWKRKDGKAIMVRLSGRATRDERGELSGFEIIAEDITQRRALERQLRQAQKFEAIGLLAGGIAHDFNNVIGAMMGWADLGLHEAPSDSSLRSHFQKIRHQADRAAALTRQLLAFARRQVLQPRNVNLNQTVTNVTSLLENIIGEQIEVKTMLAPELRLTRADPTHIEQVLMNLCLNARDAMPQGGRLLIETCNMRFEQEACRGRLGVRPGDYVLLSISDSGVGMDSVTVERIFEPFFTTKETGKGTGLGLAVVYGIVKQHGGFINVYSELGRGTTFHVYLPAGDAPVPEPEKKISEPVRGGAETILVAEDHEGVRDMAREVLETFGYKVLLASDGEEAVRMVEEHRERIALVILDVVLPKLGGPEAYQRMTAVKPGLAVIFSTGYTAEAAQLRSMLEKGAAVLQKPYMPERLARKVRETLDHTYSSSKG